MYFLYLFVAVYGSMQDLSPYFCMSKNSMVINSMKTHSIKHYPYWGVFQICTVHSFYYFFGAARYTSSKRTRLIHAWGTIEGHNTTYLALGKSETNAKYINVIWVYLPALWWQNSGSLPAFKKWQDYKYLIFRKK